MELDRIDRAEPDEIRAIVREKYGSIAKGEQSCCGPTTEANAKTSCCGPSRESTIAEAIGYTPEQTAAIPEGANLGLGCGNPLQFADVRPGETVLDLGSGAGIDAFLAAREVGPNGRVLGVDMTTAMLERARTHASRGGIANVEFRLGEIEHLPIADSSVDVIISNCVINLSPDKPQVFREALRVLRPGGRLVVSDLVLVRELPDEVRRAVSAYVGCIAGAARKEQYLEHLHAAGFTDVEVVQESAYTVGSDHSDPVYRDALQAVVSVKVRGRKPTKGAVPERLSPIACVLDALDPSEKEREKWLLNHLMAATRTSEETPTGYRLTLSGDRILLQEVGDFIALERRCCPFLSFELSVAAENGPVILHVFGRAGVKAFLEALLGSRIHVPHGHP